MQSANAYTDQNYHARNIPTLQCKTCTQSQSVVAPSPFVARSIQLLINMFNYCYYYYYYSFVDSDRTVRLVERSSVNEGMVEIYKGGELGRACGEQFDLEDATVTCRQLGFSKAVSVTVKVNNLLYPTLQSFFLRGVHCRGNEIGLQHCPFEGWSRRSCDEALFTCGKMIWTWT